MTIAEALAKWPATSLEHLGRCPVCKAKERELLLDDLADDTFRVAPGRWTLWRCGNCTNGYLDPRPDRASIGAAYAKYYTHKSAAAPLRRGALAELRRWIGNGYRNARFGTRLRPSVPGLLLLARIVPSLTRQRDRLYRFAPHSRNGDQSILDVGCGNGEWLRGLQKLGWKLCGVEPDPTSRKLAIEAGLDVRENLDAFEVDGAKFDFITLSHVIEHVHDPVQTLRRIHELLAPGGQVYIETPNLGALGLQVYGRHWRGLEAPRHLVLFNLPGLIRVLHGLSFVAVESHPNENVWRFMSTASERISRGALPDDETMRILVARYGGEQRLQVSRNAKLEEFITLTCRKAA